MKSLLLLFCIVAATQLIDIETLRNKLTDGKLGEPIKPLVFDLEDYVSLHYRHCKDEMFLHLKWPNQYTRPDCKPFLTASR